jgi:hypothetical protein
VDPIAPNDAAPAYSPATTRNRASSNRMLGSFEFTIIQSMLSCSAGLATISRITKKVEWLLVGGDPNILPPRRSAVDLTLKNLLEKGWLYKLPLIDGEVEGRDGERFWITSVGWDEYCRHYRVMSKVMAAFKYPGVG